MFAQLLKAGLVTALALGAIAVAPGVAAPSRANAEDAAFTITVDRVFVNQFGGIQVEGTMDCTAAVVAAYPNDADRPDMVLANPNWEATQYVGRTKVIRATYKSEIASPCYIKDEQGPYRWTTQTPFPDGQPTWLYSPDGKFGPGKIHVEAFGKGAGPIPTVPFPDLYAWGQADLKAQRAR
jgi:hypothetical protein